MTRLIGFSTGALARGDFRRGVKLARETELPVVELSALRLDELAPLVAALDELSDDLAAFREVSIHAPSAFAADEEVAVVSLLAEAHERGLPIVVHPDVIYTDSLWRRFGDALRIENMDLRKRLGQTAADLAPFFARLPEARFCCDLAHARQVDPTLAEAERLLLTFASRLDEIHLSHVDAESQHHRLTPEFIADYLDLAALVPGWIPVVIESPMDAGASVADLQSEAALARDALRLAGGLY